MERPERSPAVNRSSISVALAGVAATMAPVIPQTASMALSFHWSNFLQKLFALVLIFLRKFMVFSPDKMRLYGRICLTTACAHKHS